MVPSAFQASRVTIVAMEHMMITVAHVEEVVWLQVRSVIITVHAIFAVCIRTSTMKTVDRLNAVNWMSILSQNHSLSHKVLIMGVLMHQALKLCPLRFGRFLRCLPMQNGLQLKSNILN
jgi:hypothetical protein